MSAADGITSLGARDIQRLDQVLDSLLEAANVRCVVMLDRAGRLFSARGDVSGLDGTAFASLAAADFAASDQLAQLLGEREFTSLYHQGEKRSMYLLDVGGRAILATLFDSGTALGLVRIRTRSTLPELTAILDDLSNHSMTSVPLDSGWLHEATTEIDRLFAE